MREQIRNFVIIAHVDHGKSTLADRLLEVTGTVPAREMRPQYLDQLELERERGITIKMAPVRMIYQLGGKDYILNLIDTPGHSDFSYEVSRALTAVEGAILLVDVTKGIQAQTLSNLRAAERAGLTIIGAVNKIDVKSSGTEDVVQALASLLRVHARDILRLSGKTGQGIPTLLERIVVGVSAPSASEAEQALIFDSLYDDHKGIIAFVRVFGGSFAAYEEVYLSATQSKVRVKEVGYFAPQLKPTQAIAQGEIGYIATGLKEPNLVRIGDTVAKNRSTHPLPGYHTPAPVVFISFYPDGQTTFGDLKDGFARLTLSDPALTVEAESNDALGRGLKVGFLGKLHFEITGDRLAREFHLEFLTSFPSIAYRVLVGGEERIVSEPHYFPIKPDKVREPMIKVEIITPAVYLNEVLQLKNTYDLEVREIKNVGHTLLVTGRMPLSELIRDFDDRLKSVSQGFASFSYELDGEALAKVEKLEILVAETVQPALTRIVPLRDLEREARVTVERLRELLPRAQFAQAIQGRARGRIIARETIPALRKDVTGYLYGGDRTRKMKLWQKQKRGKEKLKTMAKVHISVEVFRELLKK